MLWVWPSLPFGGVRNSLRNLIKALEPLLRRMHKFGGGHCTSVPSVSLRYEPCSAGRLTPSAPEPCTVPEHTPQPVPHPSLWARLGPCPTRGLPRGGCSTTADVGEPRNHGCFRRRAGRRTGLLLACIQDQSPARPWDVADLPGGALVARGDSLPLSWPLPWPEQGLKPREHWSGQQFWVSRGNNGPQSSRPPPACELGYLGGAAPGGVVRCGEGPERSCPS